MAFLDNRGLERLWLHIVAKMELMAKGFTRISAKNNTTTTTLDANNYPQGLVLEAGDNITLVPDSATGTIKINGAAGGADVTLADLGVTATAAELNYVQGVSGSVQEQLNGKVAATRTINGKALSSDVVLSASDVGAVSQPSDTSDGVLDETVPINADTLSGMTLQEIKTLFNPGSADTLGGMTLLEIKSMLEPIGTVFQWKPVTGSNVDLSTAAAVAAYKGFGTWEQVGGRFLIGADGTYAPGTTGGEATHTLTVDEMPSHTHNVLQGTAGTSGASCLTVTTSDNRSYATSVSTGGGQAHNNMPPWLAVYTWIRIA